MNRLLFVAIVFIFLDATSGCKKFTNYVRGQKHRWTFQKASTYCQNQLVTAFTTIRYTGRMCAPYTTPVPKSHRAHIHGAFGGNYLINWYCYDFCLSQKCGKNDPNYGELELRGIHCDGSERKRQAPANSAAMYCKCYFWPKANTEFDKYVDSFPQHRKMPQKDEVEFRKKHKLGPAADNYDFTSIVMAARSRERAARMKSTTTTNSLARVDVEKFVKSGLGTCQTSPTFLLPAAADRWAKGCVIPPNITQTPLGTQTVEKPLVIAPTVVKSIGSPLLVPTSTKSSNVFGLQIVPTGQPGEYDIAWGEVPGAVMYSLSAFETDAEAGDEPIVQTFTISAFVDRKIRLKGTDSTDWKIVIKAYFWKLMIASSAEAFKKEGNEVTLKAPVVRKNPLKTGYPIHTFTDVLYSYDIKVRTSSGDVRVNRRAEPFVPTQWQTAVSGDVPSGEMMAEIRLAAGEMPEETSNCPVIASDYGYVYNKRTCGTNEKCVWSLTSLETECVAT